MKLRDSPKYLVLEAGFEEDRGKSVEYLVAEGHNEMRRGDSDDINKGLEGL